jgi:Ca-activated chloride channel homolog
MKKVRLILLMKLALLLALTGVIVPTAYSAEPGTSKIDAVLAVDVSNSMNESDVDNISFEAMKMFIDMSSRDGDRIGALAYTDTVIREKALLPMRNITDKQELKNYISQLTRGPYTDIAVGVKESVSILESAGLEKDRSPLIVLLTDGNNSLNKDRTQADSDKMLAEALKKAKDRGIPIYTIGLNADGQLNHETLKQISDETKGRSFVTSSAKDLPQILSEIYADHLKLKVVPLADITANGDFQDVAVEIPNSSVIEANISIMSMVPVEAKLFDPSGKAITLPSDGAIYTTSNVYSLIKIINPAHGIWKLQVKGATKEQIDINLVYNYALQLQADPLPAKNYQAGDEVVLKAKLMTNGQPVNDPQLYNGLKASLIITDLADGKKVEQPLGVNGQGVEGLWKIAASKEYELTIKVEGSNFVRESAPVKLTAKPLASPSSAPASPSTVPLAAPSEEEGGIPWWVWVLAGVLVVAASGAILLTLLKKSNKGFVGQLILEIKNEDTGDRSSPQFRKLNLYKGRFSLHQLLQLAPEFSDTKDILFRPGKGDYLVLVNQSACEIEKSGRVVDASKGLDIHFNDRIKVIMKQTNKSIALEYIR